MTYFGFGLADGASGLELDPPDADTPHSHLPSLVTLWAQNFVPSLADEKMKEKKKK